MFEKFKNVKDHSILVIGDIILDKYIFGDSTRISPEAPVPIVLANKKSYVLGGAANVAANLTSLGVKTYLMGQVGNDTNGELIIKLANESSIDISGIVKSNKVTTTKTRIVSKGQQMLRVDEEDIDEISEKEKSTFITMLSNTIVQNGITAIVLQDYNKGLFSVSMINETIAICNKHDLPFFVDPKHNNFWKYQNATLFKPNLSEMIKANINNNYSTLDEMLLISSKKLNCKVLMCTLAEDGIAYIENAKVERTPTEKIDVIDVSGAGDSALSIMVISYKLGYDTKSISRLANLCGKVVCMKSGVSTITINELKRAFDNVEGEIAT